MCVCAWCCLLGCLFVSDLLVPDLFGLLVPALAFLMFGFHGVVCCVFPEYYVFVVVSLV